MATKQLGNPKCAPGKSCAATTSEGMREDNKVHVKVHRFKKNIVKHMMLLRKLILRKDTSGLTAQLWQIFMVVNKLIYNFKKTKK